jgi:hypothetical protein
VAQDSAIATFLGLALRARAEFRDQYARAGAREAQNPIRSERRFDQFAYLLALVSGQIIDDDDVAGPERGNEALAQILDEDRPIHRTVDNERSGESVDPQPGYAGHRLPVSPGSGVWERRDSRRPCSPRPS